MINRSSNHHKSAIEDSKMKNWSNNKTMKNNSHKMDHQMMSSHQNIQLFPLPKSLFTISEDFLFSPSIYYSDDDYSSVDETERRRRKNSSSSSSNMTYQKNHTAIVTAALENLSVFDDDHENEVDEEIEEEEAETEERKYLASSSRWNAEDSTYNSRNRNRRNSRNSSSLPPSPSSSQSQSQSQSLATVLFVSPDRPPKRPIRKRETDADRATTLLTAVCSISLL
mmetsp:Transcript_59141/g.63810  ORF Transcript_59141/g.63810 Transcript_59141/m.63810 type:complete len:225 (+) Transcript_59141:72-746(+)